jgi:hypothetical protein
MINKSIDEIEAELNQIGRPLANDAGVNTLFLCTVFPVWVRIEVVRSAVQSLSIIWKRTVSSVMMFECKLYLEGHSCHLFSVFLLCLNWRWILPLCFFRGGMLTGLQTEECVNHLCTLHNFCAGSAVYCVGALQIIWSHLQGASRWLVSPFSCCFFLIFQHTTHSFLIVIFLSTGDQEVKRYTQFLTTSFQQH